MSLWLSERKTTGLWKGGLWKSQQGSPYAFNLDLSTFKDTVTGKSLSCNIDGTRYDEVDGVTTAFGTDVPTIADNGLRICGAYSNYFLNSGTPATQSITLAAGTYTLGILGIGNVTYNGNTATSANPVTFSLASSTTANATVVDDVDITMISKTKYAVPYVPTTTNPVSSPSEAGNSSTGTGVWIDDVQTNNPLLYSVLQSAGTMTLKWHPGFSSADVTGKLNILSFDGVTRTLDYDADSQFIRFTDGTITLVSELTVVADTVYNIKVSWGNGIMQLSVDDSVPCQGVFSGFTVSDIYFGLENEELQYISEFKVLKAENKSLTTNTREFLFDVIATQTVAGVFNIIDGQTLTVYWGDGNSNNYNGTSDQAYTHTYAAAGDYTVSVVGKSNITKFTMETSNANIYCNTADLPANLTYFVCTGSNTVTGNLSDLPANLTYFYCRGENSITGNLSGLPANLTDFYCTGSNTVTGNLSSLPANLIFFQCQGSNSITGNLSSLPANLTSFVCTGSNTVTGNLSGLPANLISFVCIGSNSITGNLSSLPANLTYFYCTGSNTISDYTTKTWTSTMRQIYHIPISSGGLSSAEVDQLLIDLAATTWTSDKKVYLKGTNAPRTSASDAAVATLQSKGVTVTTN